MREQIDERVLFSRKRFAWAADVSVRTVDYLLRAGRIRGIRVGRRTLIPRSELERLAKTGCATGAERQ